MNFTDGVFCNAYDYINFFVFKKKKSLLKFIPLIHQRLLSTELQLEGLFNHIFIYHRLSFLYIYARDTYYNQLFQEPI